MIVPYPVSSKTPVNDVLPLARPARAKAKMTEWFRKLNRCWSALHMSYRGGQYSLERLLALDEYVQKTSKVRVALVCLSAPGLLVVFVFAIESIPLQDPTAGWSANYGFWIRVAIFAMVIANGFMVQVKHFVQSCTISPRQLLGIVVFSAVLETPLAVVVSAFTAFPIPFSILTMAPSFYPILLSLFWAIIPSEVIRGMLRHPIHLGRYVKFTAALQLMAVAYPVYQTLFHYARDTSYQLPVMLLLPILKLVLKNIMFRCVTHMEDMMPEAVTFTVDFFNALYLTTNVESASSRSSVVIVVVIDIVQSFVVLYQLNQRTMSIMSRLQASGRGSDVVDAASQLCQAVETFRRQNRGRIRIRSCLPHFLSSEGHTILEQLEAVPCHSSLRRLTSPDRPIPKHTLYETQKASTWTERGSQTASRTLVGTGWTSVQSGLNHRKRSAKKHSDLLEETLEVLFTTECLLLSASLDALVPLFYGIFLLVVVRLPSAKYHSELTGVTEDNIAGMVTPIFLFSLVEVVAFVLLASLLYRNLRVNGLYQVAFVLETHQELIRAKLLTWVLMTMAFRVVHFGIDFTFKFDWISK